MTIKAGEGGSDVMTMSYDPEGKHLAVGKNQTTLVLFNEFY